MLGAGGRAARGRAIDLPGRQPPGRPRVCQPLSHLRGVAQVHRVPRSATAHLAPRATSAAALALSDPGPPLALSPLPHCARVFDAHSCATTRPRGVGSLPLALLASDARRAPPGRVRGILDLGEHGRPRDLELEGRGREPPQEQHSQRGGGATGDLPRLLDGRVQR